jgi:choice-of-anchor A domain-containing protein
VTGRILSGNSLNLLAGFSVGALLPITMCDASGSYLQTSIITAGPILNWPSGTSNGNVVAISAAIDPAVTFTSACSFSPDNENARVTSARNYFRILSANRLATLVSTAVTAPMMVGDELVVTFSGSSVAAGSLQVVNLSGSLLQSANFVRIVGLDQFATGAFLVINVPSDVRDNVRIVPFSPSSIPYLNPRSIIWNVPSAASVTVSTAGASIQGSLLAPLSFISSSSSGTVVGTAIVASDFSGGNVLYRWEPCVRGSITIF